jgi:hypothetical protein
MPLATVLDGPFILTYENLAKLWNRFETRISSFKDFENPGDELQKQEIDYKIKILNRYNNELGNEKIREMITVGKGQEALTQAAKIVTSNLVSFYSWRKSFGETNESIGEILNTFIDVATQRYAGPITIKPIFDMIDKHNLKPSWDTLSTLLWAMRPQDYFPIKISYYQKLCEELSQTLPKSIPTPEKFDNVIYFGKAFYQALQPLKPKDWIDVQSFIWCICPTSYEKLEGKKENQKKDIVKPVEGFEVNTNKPIHPLNLILYGPPGTGKTYQTVNYALAIVEDKTLEKIQSEEKESGRSTLVERFNHYKNEGQIKFLTFHQNYAYEDFIQGLKPKADNSSGSLSFELKDGVFKRLADAALKNFDASEQRIQPGRTRPPFDKVFDSYFSKFTSGEVEKVEIKMKQVSYYITEISEKSIFFVKHSGGTGHTLCINTLSEMYEQEKCFMTAGLRAYYMPLLDELLKHAKTMSLESTSEKLKNYVLIIDEINRANISRVFGELITLIEDDKRYGQINEMKVTLPSGEPLCVPSNLFIIGTMNTADKSIALLDIALRRRFEFKKVFPDADLIEAPYGELLNKINAQMVAQKGPDYQLGHAYFMPKNGNGLDVKDVFDNKIIPLLYEYFMNDGDAVKNVLTAAGINSIENKGLFEFGSFSDGQ